jgi:excisionase family DNA binding protein
MWNASRANAPRSAKPGGANEMTTRSPDSPWMTTKEAAKYIKRSRRYLLKEIHAGRLRAAIVGGRGEVLTRREWCDAWVEDHAAPILFPAGKRAG